MSRIFTISLLLLLIARIDAAAQPEAYTLLLPVFTDQGTYQGDYDIARAVVTSGGELRVGAYRPEVLARLGVREYSPTAVPDGSGGMYLIYTIEHSDSANRGDTDILIRRIDRDGEDVWNDSITGAVRFLADSPHREKNPVAVRFDDALLIAWEIEYTSGEFHGDVDIAARLIPLGEPFSEGTSLWIANSDRAERRLQLLPVTSGAIALFERGTTDEADPSGDIVAVRIAPDGSTGWSGSGPETLVAGSPHGEGNFTAVADPAGTVTVAYEIRYLSGTKAGDIDIVAQRIDHTGQRLWIDPERPPLVASSNRALERNPSISSDSSGIVIGFEIVATDRPDGATPNSVIGVQRIDTAGRTVWNQGSRSTVVPAKHRIGVAPRVRPDMHGGTFVIFDGIDTITGDRDVFAQHLTADGALSWNQEQAMPVFFGPMPEGLIAAESDGQGGVVVIAAEIPVYRTESAEPRDTTIIGHRLDRFGAHSWGIGENNLIITSAILGEHPPVVVTLGN